MKLRRNKIIEKSKRKHNRNIGLPSLKAWQVARNNNADRRVKPILAGAGLVDVFLVNARISIIELGLSDFNFNSETPFLCMPPL